MAISCDFYVRLHARGNGFRGSKWGQSVKGGGFFFHKMSIIDILTGFRAILKFLKLTLYPYFQPRSEIFRVLYPQKRQSGP